MLKESIMITIIANKIKIETIMTKEMMNFMKVKI